MIIRIGKANDNDFVVNDVHVSRYHARLIRDENGRLFIEDTDSANGTYVNGDRVIKKRVTPSDVIMLGDHYVLEIQAVLKSDNDYSEEFAALKPVYERYIKEKIRIQSTNQFKTRIFQSLPFAFVGVAGLVIGVLGKHLQGVFIGSLALAVCAPTLGIYLGARQSAKIPALMQRLSNQFKIDYVCPKCGTFLGEIPWESLANKKQCSVGSCRAKWVKKTA
ncbi:FHA domain-containing protein [Tannerella forsythia]|jgi:FOG: FHA domain|uniref:FHA domain protein n=2 Tax=Tannerella forsythia TaxID=28112 RepID=G8UPQ6_TANFA|nr:FHA domain-containing protein [Tannerella forsythia]AEW19889.1 FHA domain protein [Tannerella forsythia 92A2]KKY60431.1 ABC transporter ATP-binding protein [Tannerella forsythia]OLQ21304.1 ABC transporter ATP-binding protein [Tannerella forsythia]PDP43243.1 ABC transporter ATP-binding protein [Tannerella forsythia]PDP70766.1 ABC transporter ATP-binding protein [Tannerella forsythia]